MSDRRKEKEGKLAPGLLVLLRLAILGALAISIYLAWTSLSGKAVAGCGADSNCDKVLPSRWGYWFGLPVSVVALLLYVAVFAFTFRMRLQRYSAGNRKLWSAIFSTSIILIGVSSCL